jgi:tripeptidyl-peptidase-1
MPAFHQRVIDIATPGHDDYGRHLSKDEIDAQLRPSHKTTAAITNWLLASGISPNSINEQGHWFTFNATVKNAEELLGADFAYYQHNDDSSLRLVRTLQYSVPNDIRSHIDLIQPTTRFGQPQAQAKLVKESPDNDPNDFNDPNNTPPSPTPLDDWATGWNPDVCNSTITPDCIRGIYNMDDFNADPKFHTKLGISGFSDQVPRFDDIASFIQHFSRSQKDHDFSIVSVNGGSMDQHANGTAEANLDVSLRVCSTLHSFLILPVRICCDTSSWYSCHLLLRRWTCAPCS